MRFVTAIPIAHVHPRSEFQTTEAVREIALAVERAGFSGASLSDHPAPSADWLHNDPTGHDSLDPLVGLAFVAAATTRLKVVTNVLVLPYRNPFVSAKAAATLQVLSNDRLILGVGVGYQKVEFDALGVPFEQRGALTDEALETIRLTWKGGTVVKRGLHFDAVGNEPRPAPAPAPPIWVGGASEKALQRAARWADGWAPYFSDHASNMDSSQSALGSMEQLSAKVQRIQQLREQMGESGPFDIAVGSPFRPASTSRSDTEQFIETARKLQSHGANWIWLPLPAPSRAAYLETVAWFGEEIVSTFTAEEST
jgi:probable F420-dependent oxidoreductase